MPRNCRTPYRGVATCQPSSPCKVFIMLKVHHILIILSSYCPSRGLIRLDHAYPASHLSRHIAPITRLHSLYGTLLCLTHGTLLRLTHGSTAFTASPASYGTAFYGTPRLHGTAFIGTYCASPRHALRLTASDLPYPGSTHRLQHTAPIAP